MDEGDRPAGIRTFLIADVRGYTLFTHQRGDEAAAKLAAKFARLAREGLEARGGSMIELRGDEALAVFDSPRQAIRAAIELQETFVDETLSDPELPLAVGIGLDAGEAVPVEGGFRGGALNLAARLCGQAGPGEILASREVIHLARKVEGVRYIERGELHLKGLADPVRPIRIVSEAQDPAERLSAVVRAAPEPPGAPEQPGPRRRGLKALLSPLRVGIAALVVVIIAAAVSVGLLRRDGEVEGLDGLEGTALGFIDLDSGALLEQVPLTQRPGGIAFGAGAVWITDAVAGTVARVDAESRRVVETIQVDNGPSAVAVGEDAVWVTNGDAGTVSRINPRTNTVVQRIPVGNGPSGIAVGEGAVWVTNSFDATVSRIDTATGRVTATIGVGGTPKGIGTGGGSVWVVNQSSNTVSQIDPAAGRVVRPISVGNGPTGLAVGEGSIWVTNTGDGTLSRIDAQAGAVAATVGVGRGAGGVAVGGDSVWITAELEASVVRVETETDRVTETIPLGSAPQAVAVGGGGVWVVARGSTEIHRGGTVTVVDLEGPDQIDPATSFTLAGWQILSNTNNGLVGFKRVGGVEGVTLVPDLAASLPVPTDGGKTYTFVLRPGIRYSTGDPVTPDDVRHSIERGFKIPLGSAPFFLGAIVGADGCQEDPATCDLSEGIVGDERASSVTFHLTEPDPDFLHKLTLPLAFVLPEDLPDENVGEEPAPATGPYMIERYVPGREVVLVRNPMFREWSPGARPDGFPDEIRWRLGSEPDAQVEAVLAGEADVMLDRPPPDRVEEINTRFTDQRFLYVQSSTGFLFLNTRVSPFDDVRVRQAVNLAVDRERVVDLMGGPFQAQFTCQILPPNFPGYRPYCPYTMDPNDAGTWTGPDLNRARRLVDASGTEGMEVTLWSWPARFPGVGQYLAEVLRELGYRVSLKERNNPEFYFSRISNSENRVQAGVIVWLVDIPTPSGMVHILKCEAFSPGDPLNLNHAQFCDPEIDALIEDALALQVTDPPAASETWTEVDRMLVDAAPWVPLFTLRSMDLVSARVGNYQRNPQWGVLVDQLWVK
jgi:YVTN family beta-propeller protein